MLAPKLFISYSWSNHEHQQWVLRLATELCHSGVDVIFDKWDLKRGHAAVDFMERVVKDPAMKKVAIICDKTYAEKADGRDCGVGTETQIISKEVYAKQEQSKFAAVFCEKDEATGEPYVPLYYNSRIYIDLSEDNFYAEYFEQLLRWVFDMPLYEKPDIGLPPAFLSGDESISLGTTRDFKRAINAIKDGKTYASGAMDDFFRIFAENLERFRLTATGESFDELVVRSIEEFLPYRNEAISMFVTIAQYAPSKENITKIHRFLEKLIPYTVAPPNIRERNEIDFDNFKFIVHEIFLYAVSILLKYELFDQVNYLLSNQYYAPNVREDHQAMMSFSVFGEQSVPSLDQIRKKRLKLKHLNIRTEILKERNVGSGLDFRYLMQADFVLFIRREIEEDNSGFTRWWPDTLFYPSHFPQIRNHRYVFEMFARAMSSQYFNRIKGLLAINTKDDLSDLLQSYENDKRILPKWGSNIISLESLLGFESLATKP